MEDKKLYTVKFNDKIVLRTYDKKEAFDYCFKNLPYGKKSIIFENGNIIWQGIKP